MNEAQSMMNCSVSGLNLNGTSANITGVPFVNTVWRYWEDFYYPQVIRESYPVYLQERAVDKGQKSYEIIKTLIDKKLIKLDKVSDFVEAMDCLIKIL